MEPEMMFLSSPVGAFAPAMTCDATCWFFVTITVVAATAVPVAAMITAIKDSTSGAVYPTKCLRIGFPFLRRASGV
jgi:hypothetical protein